MKPSSAPVAVLYHALTTRNPNAIAKIERARGYMDGDALKTLDVIMGYRRSATEPPDYTEISGVNLADIDGFGNESVNDLIDLEDAQAFLKRSYQERLRRKIAALLVDTKDHPHPQETIADALLMCEHALAEMDGPTHLLRSNDLNHFGRDYIERERAGAGVMLGLGLIDQSTNGFRPQEVVVLAGTSGVGKTAFAIRCLKHICKPDRKRATLVSIEMPGSAIWGRIAQAHFRVSNVQVSNWAKLGKLDDKLGEVQAAYPGLRIVDVDKLTIGDLAQVVRLEKRKFNTQAIFIDHIQRMRYAGKEYDGLSEIARELKTIAKANDVLMVPLSQTSRKLEDATVPITMNSLRGSGRIEEEADAIIGLWLTPDMDEMVAGGVKLRSGKENLRVEFARELETMNFWARFEEDPPAGDDLPF